MVYDYLIVGAGITGCTLAERLASRGKKILLIDKRSYIGGNCYDKFDSEGNYIQKYGPHIFHTKNEEVWNYVRRFSNFNNYLHKVLAKVGNKLVPLPFSFKSIEVCFESGKAQKIIEELLKIYKRGRKVSILDLKKNDNSLLNELYDFVYNNIFLNYTIKQWDLKPEEVGEEVINRVPIIVDYEDRYFQDDMQGIPENGFTRLMEKMVSNKNIKIKLGEGFDNINLKSFKKVFFTGKIDSFFDYKFGKVKYRNVSWDFEKIKDPSFQKASVINYPNEEKFTRITEFNKFLDIINKTTVIAKEFPSWEEGVEAYPLQTEENKGIIKKYLEEAEKQEKVVFVGRLAEGKYYNIDDAIYRAMEVLKNEF